MAIRVLVNGATGRMGQETIKAVSEDPQLELVGQASKNDNLADAIRKTKPDVVVDFTVPTAVYQNASTIIAAHVHPVIGTSGLTSQQIQELQKVCASKKLGGVIAPNFSIGAILMMRFAKEAAHYFPKAEIIEMHHSGKLDSPSGTAIRTSELIAEVHQNRHIPIHSVRLPGIVARQDVIFGVKGETLTICHNSIHRESFMPGVCLACKKVVTLGTLIYGMESLLG